MGLLTETTSAKVEQQIRRRVRSLCQRQELQSPEADESGYPSPASSNGLVALFLTSSWLLASFPGQFHERTLPRSMPCAIDFAHRLETVVALAGGEKSGTFDAVLLPEVFLQAPREAVERWCKEFPLAATKS